MAEPSADMPLAELLARAADGQEQAWESLVAAYAKRVYGLIASHTADRDLAEEITQQTFVKVVRHVRDQGRYEEKGRFESWLFRIAMNALRDEMRRRRRAAVPMRVVGGDSEDDGDGAWQAVHGRSADGASHDGDPLAAMEQAELIEQLQQAVARLPEADRQILHLRHTAGLSFPQIAETLEQPLGTVLARAHRAIGKLRKLMTPDEQTLTGTNEKRSAV